MKRSNANTKGVVIKVSEPLFNPGRVVMTRGVEELLHAETLRMKDICLILSRHITGDWGELDAHDRRVNEDALRDGSRIFSAYRTAAGEKLWVITEAVGERGSRASTTVLLPEEY